MISLLAIVAIGQRHGFVDAMQVLHQLEVLLVLRQCASVRTIAYVHSVSLGVNPYVPYVRLLFGPLWTMILCIAADDLTTRLVLSSSPSSYPIPSCYPTISLHHDLHFSRRRQ